MSQESHPFVFAANAPLSALEKELDAAWQKDEAEHVRFLLDQVPLDDQQRSSVKSRAVDLVARVRARSSREAGVMEAFMREYDLSSEEGVILMCLAEALLRIPDNHTAEALISDKLSDADWEAHLGKSSSVLVNAGTWRSEEHTSELQSRGHLVCRLLLDIKKTIMRRPSHYSLRTDFIIL